MFLFEKMVFLRNRIINSSIHVSFYNKANAVYRLHALRPFQIQKPVLDWLSGNRNRGTDKGITSEEIRPRGEKCRQKMN